MTFLDRLAAIVFPLSRDEAFERKCCIRCEDPIDEDWTTQDLREWEITGLCGECWDAITEPVE